MNEALMKEIKELKRLLNLADIVISEVDDTGEIHEWDRYVEEWDLYQEESESYRHRSETEKSSFSVKSVTPFGGESSALASCVIYCGLVTIRAKLFKSSVGNIFLSLPARRDKNGKYWDCCTIVNREIFDEIERIAVEMYTSKVLQASQVSQESQTPKESKALKVSQALNASQVSQASQVSGN